MLRTYLMLSDITEIPRWHFYAYLYQKYSTSKNVSNWNAATVNSLKGFQKTEASEKHLKVNRYKLCVQINSWHNTPIVRFTNRTKNIFYAGEDGLRQDEMGHMYRLLQKKEQEVIKMMIAIFIGFCLTYLPSFITTMVWLVFS